MLRVERISAVTLAVRDMRRAVAFYRKAGFRLIKGGPEADFTTFEAGRDALNLFVAARPEPVSGWGRAIFYVTDVDKAYQAMRAAGLAPDFPPADAPWGERYFHLTDPDGHELSFAAPLR